MRFRDLRRTLQQIVLAGLPVAALPIATSGCVEALIDSDCVDTIHRTFEVQTPAEPALQFRIDSCRVDADACTDLCELAIAENEGITKTPTQCKVAFLGDTVEIRLTYEVYIGGSNCPVEGRRPAGLAPLQRVDARSAAGAWLAQAAWLEAASIHAFLQLARELEHHGAPRSLIRWALLSADEEVRHTKTMARLAERYGALAPLPEVALPAPRSLEELAIENAAEGCVRETWGALLAEWQSRVAPDPELRAAFAGIARDEARHAALAFAVDRWVRERLDAGALARVEAARAAAVHELATETTTPGTIAAAAALGLPQGLEARGLWARAHNSLWSNGGPTCRA